MRQLVVGATLVLLLAPAPRSSSQLPLAPASRSGQTVTPAFEGWYPNADGTFSISFGYLNRNSVEVVEVPIGPDNAIEPGPQNQGQPTHFRPGRHWGVFAIKVPADSRDRSVVWTLRTRGEAYAIPGRLHPNWQIDALEGEAGSGNTPPVLRFDAGGPEGRGPLGVTAGPVAATVGQPLALTVWARDDGRTSGSVASPGKEAVPVTLAWYKHQGPGDVTFSKTTEQVPTSGGSMTTTVMFSEPGEYIVRVRANDASGVAGAGHAQCCWTNGFVRVAVADR
jgi:hypothetical protein